MELEPLKKIIGQLDAIYQRQYLQGKEIIWWLKTTCFWMLFLGGLIAAAVILFA